MFSLVKNSALELKSVKNLCIVSILMALRMVVGLFSIKLTPYLVIGFGFLVYLVVGSMFGPIVSMLFGFFSDVLHFFIFPSGGASFHFGFTLSSILSVLVYGLFLYKFKLSVLRVVICQIVHDVFIFWILNTIWVSQMYFKNNFAKAFSLRIIKEIGKLPINCILAVIVALVLKRFAKTLMDDVSKN